MFFKKKRPFSLSPGDGCDVVKIPLDRQFAKILRPDDLAAAATARAK